VFPTVVRLPVVSSSHQAWCDHRHTSSPLSPRHTSRLCRRLIVLMREIFPTEKIVLLVAKSSASCLPCMLIALGRMRNDGIPRYPAHHPRAEYRGRDGLPFRCAELLDCRPEAADALMQHEALVYGTCVRTGVDVVPVTWQSDSISPRLP
jgi:hypothetical protein